MVLTGQNARATIKYILYIWPIVIPITTAGQGGENIGRNLKTDLEVNGLPSVYFGVFVFMETVEHTADSINGLLIERGSKIRLTGLYNGFYSKAEFTCQDGHISQKSPFHVLSGKGCFLCETTSGFKTNKTAFFYVYDITYRRKRGIGFGITNHPKERHISHMKSFVKSNSHAVLLYRIRFASGSEALRLETMLKRHPKIFNLGIEGFKTECLPVRYKKLVLDMVTNPRISF